MSESYESKPITLYMYIIAVEEVEVEILKQIKVTQKGRPSLSDKDVFTYGRCKLKNYLLHS